MARKKNIELGIDLLVNNYTEAAKSLDEISKLTSSFDGITQKNKTHINELKLALQALGKNMPTNELKNFIKANVNISSSIGSINNAFREHQKTIKATEAQYSATIKKVEEYQQKIKELGDITAPVKKSKKAAELLATPAFAQANNLLKQRKVGANAQDPDQAKWTALKTSTDENAKKLVATVNQYVEAQEAARKKLADLTAELNKANAQLKQQETVLTELRNTAQTFEQVQTHVESASEAINENNQAMGQAHSAALKTGEAQISLKKSTDATTTSFGKAARSIFNYTILYQGLKQVLRESIRTIKEMDDAITGMTVVTSLSREQA